MLKTWWRFSENVPMSFCVSGQKKDGLCRHLDRVGDNRLQDNRLIDICWRKKRVYSRRLTIFARYCGNRKKIKYISHYGI